MALGGVATGSIKAQDAATAIKLAITTGSIPKLALIATNTGINNAALAVLLASSVKNTTKPTITSTASSALVPFNRRPSVSPNNKLVPVASNTWLKHKPPPNKNNTPHSVVFSISSQYTTRLTVSAISANSATKLSKEAILPNKLLMGLLKTHKTTAAAKITRVVFCSLFHSTLLSSSTIVRLSLGFNSR